MQPTTDTPRPVPAVCPVCMVEVVDVLVPAGFPSPAQDYQTSELDLNEHLIRDRLSTFIMRVSGSSMMDAGIAASSEAKALGARIKEEIARLLGLPVCVGIARTKVLANPAWGSL